LVGGGYNVIAHSPTLIGNYTYRGASVNVGYQGGATDITLENNYFPEGIITNGNVIVDSGNIYMHENEPRVFVRRAYPGRIHVAVYNWSGAASVIVDLSRVTNLSFPDFVKVHNIQDYFNDIQMLQLDSNKCIQVDMLPNHHTVALPNGTGWESPVSSFPLFGAFVIDVIDNPYPSTNWLPLITKYK
jgi:hypothetical protein